VTLHTIVFAFQVVFAARMEGTEFNVYSYEVFNTLHYKLAVESGRFLSDKCCYQFSVDMLNHCLFIYLFWKKGFVYNLIK
jgi:hypothetical protein